MITFFLFLLDTFFFISLNDVTLIFEYVSSLIPYFPFELDDVMDDIIIFLFNFVLAIVFMRYVCSNQLDENQISRFACRLHQTMTSMISEKLPRNYHVDISWRYHTNSKVYCFKCCIFTTTSFWPMIQQYHISKGLVNDVAAKMHQQYQICDWFTWYNN